LIAVLKIKRECIEELFAFFAPPREIFVKPKVINDQLEKTVNSPGTRATLSLMNTKTLYTIEDLEYNDIPRLRDMPPRSWEFDISFFMERFYHRPWFYALKAVIGDQIAGTGSIIFNNGTSWLSNIIVRPEYRGQGLGRAITTRLMDISSEMDCPACLLMATEEGRGLYEKLGFADDGVFCYYTSHVPLPFCIPGQLSPVAPEEGDRLLELDRQVTGEDRAHMLADYLHTAYVFRQDGNVRGFYLPAPGDGPVIAADAEAGTALLGFKHASAEKTTVIPEENPWAAHFFRKHGIEPFSCRTRMVHGPRPSWRPEGVFCRIEGYYC